MTDADRGAGGEVQARVRAAMAYRDLNWAEVAAAFETSVSTVKRRLHRLDRNGDAYRRELAHLCSVPEWFILEGFAPPFVPPSVQRDAQEMEELQQRDEEGRRRHGA
jgi:hypothetical protein